MAGCGGCHDSTSVAGVTAPVNIRVRIQPLQVEASLWDSYAVSVANFRGEITDDDRDIVDPAPPAEETDDAFLPVRAVDPFKSGRLAIAFVQRRHLPVHRIQIAYEPLYSRMERIGKQMPVKACIVIPFGPLTEFAAHEQ